VEQSSLLPCNGALLVADFGVKGMVAPGRRVVVVEATVKIVDARRSMTTGEGFGGARLLADVNMKRDLEVNAWERLRRRGEEKTREADDDGIKGRRHHLYLCHIAGPDPKCPFIARISASVHSSFVHLSCSLPKLVEYQLL
jgi:hypothetical protein